MCKGNFFVPRVWLVSMRISTHFDGGKPHYDADIGRGRANSLRTQRIQGTRKSIPSLWYLVVQHVDSRFLVCIQCRHLSVLPEIRWNLAEPSSGSCSCPLWAVLLHIVSLLGYLESCHQQRGLAYPDKAGVLELTTSKGSNWPQFLRMFSLLCGFVDLAPNIQNGRNLLRE